MLDFDTIQWIAVGISAMMIGFSKTGIPGGGILVVPLMAAVMPAKNSTGFVLPMLALADIMAIIYWRRHVDWPKLLRLLPWTFAGVLIGAGCLHLVNNTQLMPIIGMVVLGMLIISWWKDRSMKEDTIPTGWLFRGTSGVLAGGTSMLANAAGPIMTIYFLAMRLDKKEFVGTSAWFFWILNLSKMPFSSKMGLISRESLMTNLAMLPAIILGGCLGIYLVHRIPQKPFNTTVKVLAALAAVFLCVKPWVLPLIQRLSGG